MNAVWRDNALYMTAVIYPDSGPTPINAATLVQVQHNNPQVMALADQGNVGGEELGFKVNTGWPAVNVDSKGNMAIGFAAAGPNLYPGAYYAVRLPATSGHGASACRLAEDSIRTERSERYAGETTQASRWIRPMA